MYYVAQFDYAEKEQDDEGGGIGSRMAYFTMFVEADNKEDALTAFAKRLEDLHKTNEIFYDVDNIYLQAVTEMEHFSTTAQIGQWFSLAPLGNGFMEMSTVVDEEMRWYDMGTDDEESELEPFVTFDEDYETSGTQTPLYFEFLREKRYGKKLELEDVDEGTIDYLHHGEGISNQAISRLFDACLEDVEKFLGE